MNQVASKTPARKPIVLWHGGYSYRHDDIVACGHEVLEVRDGRVYVQAECAGDRGDMAWVRLALPLADLVGAPGWAQPLDRPDGQDVDWGEGAYGMGDPVGCGEFYRQPESIACAHQRLAPRSTSAKSGPVDAYAVAVLSAVRR